MSWQVLIGLFIIFYSVSILLQRVILKESNSKPITFSIVYQFLIGLLFCGIAFFTNGFLLPNLKFLIFSLILGSFLYGFANIFNFKSLKIIEASKFIIIFSSRVFFTILASSLLLKEGLLIKQFFGVLLIFLGVIILNFERKKFSFRKGEWLSLGGAICFGLAQTNDRYLLQHFNLYSYMAIIFILPPLIMSGIYPKQLKYIKLFFSKKLLPKIFLLCIFYGLAALSFYGALKVGHNSSQVASVSLSTVVVTVLLSIVLLKERKQLLKKIAASAITFLGLILLS